MSIYTEDLRKKLNVNTLQLGEFYSAIDALCLAVDQTAGKDRESLAKEQGLPTSLTDLFDRKRKIQLTPDIVENWYKAVQPLVPEKARAGWRGLNELFGEKVVNFYAGLNEKAKRTLFDAVLPERIGGSHALPDRQL